jgi:branched-chain amino acid transport system permease protein
VDTFFQQLVNGVTTGSLYALIALGYSMVYGVLKLLNFAHGDLYMIGAFVGYFMIQWFGGPAALVIPVPLLLLLMFVVAGAGVGALGVAIERFAYRPLRDAPRIAPLITALGVSFFLENAVLLLFGSQTRIYNTSQFISFSTGITIRGLHIDIVRIMVISLSVVLMIALRLLVSRTTLGKSMRAVATDREAAEMLGIDVDRTIAFTFGLGGALAGAAGVLWVESVGTTRWDLGFRLGLYAFTAAVLGGIGNLQGAVLGGFLIGIVQNINDSLVLGQKWSQTVGFGILIVLMVFKPEGILGKPSTEKV